MRRLWGAGFVTALAAVTATAVLPAPASGAEWTFESLDGGGSDVGSFSSATVSFERPHVFYGDDGNGDLRHGWWNGQGWAFETLDGNSGAGGRTTNDVGDGTAAVVVAGALHAFYRDATAGNLRHAWWTGVQWRYETLDGDAAGAFGRVSGDVGEDPAALVVDGRPHVWYLDESSDDLRHAWWTGAQWARESLDGSAGSVSATAGDVGAGASAVLSLGRLHLFYDDRGGGDLRHAWWTGAQWGFEDLDGAGTDVGSDTAALADGTRLHVFYRDDGGGNLRHAWWTGAQWGAETLDGVGGGGGRVDANTGADATVLWYGGGPHVFYDDGTGGDLRHAWWAATTWGFEDLDGHVTDLAGRLDADVGPDASVLAVGDVAHVFYDDEEHGDLRHGWYDAPPTGRPSLALQVVVGGLSHPWDVGFSSDGAMFYTQRSGPIRVRMPGGADSLIVSPGDVAAVGEGGMLGLAVDPQHATNRYVYACYATAGDVRVVRYQVNASSNGIDAATPIVTGMPHNPTGRHSGCRPRFRPGTAELWIATGDAANGVNPQSPTSLGGKVLRVDRDGNGVAGNPGGALDPRILTYGHRNLQGLAFRPGDNVAFSVEHGPARDDEVNVLLGGANYGWDPVPGYNEAVPMTNFALTPPVFGAVWSSGIPTIAPSGATFLSGPQWGSWNGALAMAVLKGQHLRVLHTAPSGAIAAQETALDGGVRLRSAVQGPDGNLYVTTDVGGGGGQIWRIVPF